MQVWEEACDEMADAWCAACGGGAAKRMLWVCAFLKTTRHVLHLRRWVFAVRSATLFAVD